MKHDSKRKARRSAARPGGRLDWRRAAFLAMLVCPWAWGQTVPQNVLPAGFNLKSGSVATPTTASNSLTIIQSSSRAVIEWSNFSIGAGKSVTFTVPNKSAITLSKVVAAPGTIPPRSEINGSLTSNGQVWLLNPSGVLIGPTGSINTAGFLASTHQLWDTSNNTGLADSAFLTAGNSFALANPGFGQIVNQGSITATNGGYVILAGREVRNERSISAVGGQIALGAGNMVNISFNNDKLLSFAVNGAPSTSGTATNLGSLIADGGKIWLSARAAASVTTAVINTSGTVQARFASNEKGEIVLDGGDSKRVEVRGVLDVRGMNTDEQGGAIKIYGNEINVAASTKLDARGGAGGGTISVGGGPSIPPAASVSIGTNAELNASAINSGNGGSVVVESAMTNPLSMTRVLGSLFATGGRSGGNGGTIVTRGFGLDAADAKGSAKALVAGGTPGSWEFSAVGLGVGQAPSIGDGTPPPASITGAQIGNLLTDGTAVSINSMSGSNNGNLIPGNLNVWQNIEKASGPRDVALQLNAMRDVVINAGIEHKGGGKLGINLRADSDGNGAGEVTVANGQYLRSGGGDIKLGGGLDPQNDYARNVQVFGDIAAGSGNVTIRGQGPAGGGTGVVVGTEASIQGTQISITGRGQLPPPGGEAPIPHVVKIDQGAEITGDQISIEGTAAGNGSGVVIGAGPNLGSKSQITASGNLTITGHGTDGAQGILLTDQSKLQVEGAIALTTDSGNITLGGEVRTENRGANAIVIAAGTSAAAGTPSGGNVMIQDTAQIGTGTNGRVRLYTGSIAGSAGLVAFAGQGSGGFRYNSTQASAGFTTELGSSGKFVIYRERPVIGLAAPGGSITYGDLLPAVQYMGLVNGDTRTQAVPTAPNVIVDGTKSSSGNPTVGDHSTSVSPLTASALGYRFNHNPAKLTVTRKNLSISGITARDKTYDGNTKAGLDIAAAQLTGQIGGDDLSLRDSGNFTDKNVARDANGNPIARPVTLANTLTGRDADNYQLSPAAPISATIRPRVLSIGLVGNPTKQVDGTDTAFLLAENFSIRGLINGESLAVTPTTGRYVSALPGTGIAVETPVPPDKVQAGTGTLVSNYALPVAPVTGTGTIKPLPERKVSAELPKGNTPLMPSQPAPAPTPAPTPAADQTPPRTESGTSNSPAARQSADDKRQEKQAADTAPERGASNDKPRDETAPTQTTVTEKTDTPTPDAPAERSAANDKPTDKPKDERVATQPSASPDKPAATTTASAAATLVAKVERTSTLTVAAPPPSPVPQEKPPTPRDTADSADRTLAAANTPAPPKPAPQARRQAARKVEVSQGLVAVQPATRAASTAGAPRDPRISMNGNTGKW